MRVLLQRTIKAKVTIESETIGEIGRGLLILVGMEDTDNQQDIEWLSRKIVNLRIFDDAQKIPNLSIKDVQGDLLVVSQFTLHASTRKGNRPSYIRAARPEAAIPLYENFVAQLELDLGKPVSTGKFGADMQVSLVNDGPMTIWIDTRTKD